MSTTTASRPGTGIFSFSTGQFSSATFAKSDDGQSATITGWPVFKAGTFADSMGFVETWTVEHLAQMVSNFNLLRTSVPHIPVRADHGRSVENIKGYITDLRVESGFLLADLDLTEPDAVAKWERGTYRNRSAEIGFYETNEGAAYYPVFLGVAFVDFGAVEGLFSRSTPTSDQIRYFTEASPSMPTNLIDDKAPGTLPPSAAPAALNVTVQGVPGMFAMGGNTITENATSVTTTPPPAPSVKTYTFGDEQLTEDQVQARLDFLAEFQRQQLASARQAFAAELVKGKRFTAPQEKDLGEFFVSLNADQFAKAQALFTAAPELSILGTHTDGVTNPDNTGGELSERDRQIAKHEAILRQHTLAGMPKDRLEKTESFMALQRLRAQGSN